MRIVALFLFIASVWLPGLAAAHGASSAPEVASVVVRSCMQGGHIETHGGRYLLMSSLGKAIPLPGNREDLVALKEGIERKLQGLPSVQRVKVRACLMSLRGAIANEDAAAALAEAHVAGAPTTMPQNFEGNDTTANALQGLSGGPNSILVPAFPRDDLVGHWITHYVHPLGGSIEEFGNALRRRASKTFTVQVAPQRLGSELILASRTFAGPGQYPPGSFAAYGIVAFPSMATGADKARYEMICNAYVASLTFYGEVSAPVEEQMVTVWPVEDDREARQINAMPRSDELCKAAVEDYGMPTALDAIDAARRSHAFLTGQGPFLLAWSPSKEMGQPDALVLVSNLSDVTTLQQAKEIFRRWRRDIVENPEIWRRGWNLQTVRLDIQLWSDKYGTEILKIFGIADNKK